MALQNGEAIPTGELLGLGNDSVVLRSGKLVYKYYFDIDPAALEMYAVITNRLSKQLEASEVAVTLNDRRLRVGVTAISRPTKITELAGAEIFSRDGDSLVLGGRIMTSEYQKGCRVRGLPVVILKELDKQLNEIAGVTGISIVETNTRIRRNKIIITDICSQISSLKCQT